MRGWPPSLAPPDCALEGSPRDDQLVPRRVKAFATLGPADGSPQSFFHCRRPACCTCRIVRSQSAGDRGRRPDTVAVLVGGMTTVAPRAPAAS